MIDFGSERSRTSHFIDIH